MNHQFIFTGKLKAFLAVLIVLGVVCFGLTIALDDQSNIRWLTNLLHNSAFFAGISFAALFFLCTHIVAWGGWQVIFKRIPEAMMMFLPVGAVLMLVVGGLVAANVKGTEFLYLWSNEAILNPADEAHFDELAYHKTSFLNTTNFFLTIVVVLIWSAFAFIIRKLSIQQDADTGLRVVNLSKSRFWSAVFLPIAGFSSAYVIWQWIMSVDTHWYSTMFAWYSSVSLWISAICIILLIVIYLKSRGYLQQFTNDHMHDLGKYIFGFSVFWTYLWFSQFMLIWYANNGEETQYFFIRFEQFKPVFFLNLIINFVLPFFILLMNSSKRTLGTMGFAAGLVLFGHWLDFYQMIKPGVWYNYEHAMHHAAEHHHGDEHGDVHSSTTLQDAADKFNGGKAVLTYYQNDHGHGTPAPTTTDSASTDTAGHTMTTPEPTTPTHDHGHGDNTHSDHAHGDAAHAHHHNLGFTMGIHFPGILEVGTMLGFLGLFLFITFTFLSKASLYPKNDPFLGESEDHHVWPFIGEH